MFDCEKCNFHSSSATNYNKHILTRKHLRDCEPDEKNSQKHVCECCSFRCSKKCDFIRHTFTRKHKKNVLLAQENAILDEPNYENSIVESDANKVYECDTCGKTYKAKSSMWSHRVSCLKIHEKNPFQSNNTIETYHKNQVYANNDQDDDELTNFFVESETDEDINAQIIHLLKYVLRKNEELSNQVTNVKKDVMNHLDIVANTLQPSNVTNNNNNTQFNMNFFLNEQCKDAVNVSDFIESLELNFADLQTVAEKGFILGNYEIIKDKFSELGIYRRPIHCSDLKRETVYVRENNEWQKEASDHPLLKKLIVYVAHRVSQQCTAWHHENPDFMQSQEKKDLSLLFMNSSFGVNGKSDSDNKAKIAKNVLEFVEIDKRRLK